MKAVLCLLAFIAITWGRTTPPLGWNTWDAYTMNISESLFMNEVNWFSKNLKQFGWEYVVIDAGWDYVNGTYHTDGYSRTIPNPDTWPSSKNGVGLKAVADQVHSQGLLLGLHLMRGINVFALQNNDRILGTPYHAKDIAVENDKCVWDKNWYGINMNHPAAVPYYHSLMVQMSSWGVDFIKVDCIGFGRDQHDSDIIAISDSVAEIKRRTGHEIVYSLSPGAKALPADVRNVNAATDMYRITNDLWDCWDNDSKSPNCDGITVSQAFNFFPQWTKFIGQHGLNGPSFPDGDMLPIGIISPNRPSTLTPTQERILVTLWAIFRNPLMIGSQLSTMPQHTYQTLTNREVLSINQNTSGNKPVLVDSINQGYVWVAVDKTSSVPKYYAALFNINSSKSQKIQVTFGQLGITETHCDVYDVWAQRAIGQATTSYSITLDPESTQLVRLTNCT